MTEHKGLPVQLFATMDEWLTWLESNHESSAGLWVQFAKKGSGVPSITYEQAREGAIIYGWIDGLKHGMDETYYLLRFMPRKPKSTWSKINCEIAEGLISQGKMHPAGLRQVEAARADGRWDLAYDSPSTMEVPEDFQRALELNPAAKACFETINKTNRYAFLYRIQTAKKAETRSARIQKFIEMLSEGKVIHP